MDRDGMAALGWTQTHLVDLPGFAGSEDPPHRLEVGESAGSAHLSVAGPECLAGARA